MENANLCQNEILKEQSNQLEQKIENINKTFIIETKNRNEKEKDFLICGIKRRDLTNSKFGKLTAISYLGLLPTGKKGTKRSKWRCKCDCGNFVDILSSNLYNGNSTSCGCKTKHDVKYNFIDLTGKQFGDLIVINLLPEKTKHRGALWNCQCKCGNFVKVASNSLTSGNKLTCGKSCSMKRRNKRVGEISLAHINAIKQNAIKRNLSFTVTPQYLWDLFLRQNRKCALSGVDLTFTQEINTHNTRATLTSASLDRIDSSKGYDERNVRWVHKDINRMKWSCDDATFLDWCKKCILHHHESKNFTV